MWVIMKSIDTSNVKKESGNMPCCVCQVVQSFRLTLQVADMSGMGLTSTGRAIIHISDINNHAPEFQPAVV